MDLEFDMTCIACPEQYDVYWRGKQVAYVRLRHGYLTVECPDVKGKLIYSKEFTDLTKGAFSDEADRAHYMVLIRGAIERHYDAENRYVLIREGIEATLYHAAVTDND